MCRYVNMLINLLVLVLINRKEKQNNWCLINNIAIKIGHELTFPVYDSNNNINNTRYL